MSDEAWSAAGGRWIDHYVLDPMSAASSAAHDDSSNYSRCCFLLVGPSGSGKANSVYSKRDRGIGVTEVDIAGIYGHAYSDGSRGLHAPFEAARKGREVVQVVLLRHIELLCPGGDAGNQEGSSEADFNIGSEGVRDTAIVAQLLHEMDALRHCSEANKRCVFVATCCAANPSDAVDSLLLRKFDEVIQFNSMNAKERGKALPLLNPSAGAAMLDRAVALSGGMTYRDASNLYFFSKTTKQDFGTLLRHTSAFRSGAATGTGIGEVEVPNVPLSTIVGLDEAKKQLVEALTVPLVHGKELQQLGVAPSIGVLLYGAPGTGKTMLAKAIATEFRASFFHLDIPQLLRGHVGESERILHELFNQAQHRSPSVVFLDEVQAVFGRRAGDASESGHETRLVSFFLTELDRLRSHVASHPVVIVAATNVPSMLDPAALSPSRLGCHVYIPPPDRMDRERFLRGFFPPTGATAGFENTQREAGLGVSESSSHGRARQHQQDYVELSAEVLEMAVHQTEGFTGADLRHFCNVLLLKAVPVEALEKRSIINICILADHILAARASVKPSVTENLLHELEAWQ